MLLLSSQRFTECEAYFERALDVARQQQARSLGDPPLPSPAVSACGLG